MSKLRDDVWHILNDYKDQRHTVFQTFINVLIFLSVGLLLYETFMPPDALTLEERHRRELFQLLDRFILGVFLIEYIGRLWVIRGWKPAEVRLTKMQTARYFILSRIKFILSPWGIIDGLALLPIVPFLRSLRVLRLLRLFRSVKLFRYHSPLRVLAGAVRDNTLLFSVSFGVVAVNIVLSAVMFFFAEYGHNENVNDLGDTFWWAIVTISTVGFGDITPSTPGGRVIGAGLMFSGMFVIALFAGVISSTLVGHLIPLQMERVRMSSISDHIIIAGWNDNVPMLLEQLSSEYVKDPPDIIIFAPVDRPDILGPEYIFVHGDFTKEDEYDKVRIKFASTVIVISDTSRSSVNSSARDATSVLTIFTIRRLEHAFIEERYHPLHICAEILDPENVDHARIAGADEVLATALVGNSLLAHTATNPGIGSILSDLLLATRNNIYTSPMPNSMIEGELLTFQVLQDKLRLEHGVMLIGILHNEKLRLNPDGEQPVFLEDQIVYIGDHRLTPGPER